MNIVLPWNQSKEPAEELEGETIARAHSCFSRLGEGTHTHRPPLPVAVFVVPWTHMGIQV